jgi:Arc/MetJ-type ribon-helix-helix transcriptional regulator
MANPVGGRGHKAPYTTTHVRVPEPVKTEVERLVADYKAECPGRYVSRDELIEICQAILIQKKSAKQSLNKLLTTLFSEDVTL